MAEFSVTVQLDASTVTDLMNQGASLYVFHGVTTCGGGGFPVVWAKVPVESSSIVGPWPETYDGYGSTAALVDGGNVLSGYSFEPLSLGQLMKIGANATVSGVSDTGVPPTQLWIESTVATAYVCGIGPQIVPGKLSPCCAFPLSGLSLQTFQPLVRVVLAFSSVDLALGTIVTGSLPATPPTVHSAALTKRLAVYSQNLVIDLDAGMPDVTVSYSSGASWSFDATLKARAISSTAPLSPYLIVPPK